MRKHYIGLRSGFQMASDRTIGPDAIAGPVQPGSCGPELLSEPT